MPDLWTAIEALGDRLPGWVATMTLWTGAVLVFAALADRLLRKRIAPAWRVALYLAVFVRVALPADWHSPLSVWPSAAPPAVATASVDASAPQLVAFEAPALIGGAHPDPEAHAATATALFSVRAGHWLAGLYGLGVVAWLGRILVSRRRLVRAARSATPARTSVAALAPGVRVLEHASLGPLAFGIRRGVIVVPADVVETLSAQELRCVLAHEHAHLRRHDPALALAVAFVVSLAWPLLPVWLAAARVRHLIELAADERALAGSNPRTYGQTLIELAERPTPRLALAAAVPLGSFADLRGRVAALRQHARLPRLLQPLCAAGIAVLVLACAGLEGEAGEDPDQLAHRCEQLKVRATTLHDEGEKTGEAMLRTQALEAYDEHADRCASDPDHAELLYYRAELMWAMAIEGDRADDADNFGAAQQAFRLVLEHHSGRFTQDAATGQLLAKWNAVGLIVGETSPFPGAAASAKEPRSEYTPEELELLATYDTYQLHVDDAKPKACSKCSITAPSSP